MSLLDDILDTAGSGFTQIGNALGFGNGGTADQAFGAAKKIVSSNLDPFSGGPRVDLMDILNAPGTAVQQIPGEQSLPAPVRAGLESAAYAIPAVAGAAFTGGASLSDLAPAAARLGLMGLGGYAAGQGVKAVGGNPTEQTLGNIGGQVLTDVLTRHIAPPVASVTEEPAPAASPGAVPPPNMGEVARPVTEPAGAGTAAALKPAPPTKLPPGTQPNEATQFSNEGSWYHGGADQEVRPGAPFFLTRNPEAAQFYATERYTQGVQPGSKVRQFSVQLNNPALLPDVEEAAQRLGITPEEVQKAGGSGEMAWNSRTNREDLSNPNDYLYVPRLVDDLKDQGFDGFQGWDQFNNGEVPIRVVWDKSAITASGGAETAAQRAQRIASGVLNDRAAQIATDAGYGHLVDWEVPGERLTTKSYADLRNPGKTGGRDFYAEAGSAAGMPLVPRAEVVYDENGVRSGFITPDGREFLWDRGPNGSFTGTTTQFPPGSLEDMGYIRGPQAINAPSGSNAEAIASAEDVADRYAPRMGPGGAPLEASYYRNSNAGRQWSDLPPRDAGPPRPPGVGGGGATAGGGGRPMGGGPSTQMADESGLHYAGRALVDAVTLPTRILTVGHAPIRQAGPMMLGEVIGGRPGNAASALGNFFRVLGGMSLRDVQDELHALPYGGFREDGLGAMNWMAHGKQALPATFVQKAADKIPFLKRFGDAGQAMIQTIRVAAYNSDMERLAKLGMTGEDLTQASRASWGAISAATGHGKAFERMPNGSAVIFFSPQALLGRVLAPFKVLFGTGAPWPFAAGSRAAAIRSLLGTATTIAIADGIGQALGAKLSLGSLNNSPWTNNFPGNAGPINKLLGLTGVNIRQMNTNLGKAQFGTTKVDPTLGYGPLIRMFGNAGLAINDNDPKALVGHVAQYFSGQLGPTLDVAIDALIGQKVWNGEAFHLSDLKTQNELINRFAPIAAQAIWDAAHTSTGNPLAAGVSALGIGAETSPPSAHFQQVAPNGNWRDYNRYSQAQDTLSGYRNIQQQASDLAWQMALQQHPEWAQYDGLNGSRRFDGLAEALSMPVAQGGAGMTPDAAVKLANHLAGPYYGFMSYAERRYLTEHPEILPVLQEWQYSVPKGAT